MIKSLFAAGKQCDAAYPDCTELACERVLAHICLVVDYGFSLLEICRLEVREHEEKGYKVWNSLGTAGTLPPAWQHREEIWSRSS